MFNTFHTQQFLAYNLKVKIMPGKCICIYVRKDKYKNWDYSTTKIKFDILTKIFCVIYLTQTVKNNDVVIWNTFVSKLNMFTV